LTASGNRVELERTVSEGWFRNRSDIGRADAPAGISGPVGVEGAFRVAFQGERNMEGKKPLVGIVMGSDSDLEIMREAALLLDEFAVPFELFLTSAHRTPARTAAYADSAEDRGIRVFIVGAGAAAHLAGVIASRTLLPVIGVPIDATSLRGLDALLSTVQMPGGVPVAAMAIGKAGARNGALLAIQILALGDGGLLEKLRRYRLRMAADVETKQGTLQWKS